MRLLLRVQQPTQDKIKGAIFSSLGNIFDGGNFLDCYSGTGNMGLEAVSRGMDHATLVDNNKGAISVIKENVKNLKADKETKIICGNIFTVLERLTLKYDVVYIDPPYAKQENEKLIQKLDDLDMVKLDGVIDVESVEVEVWPERIACFNNFIANSLSAIAAYCFFEKKPAIDVNFVNDGQLSIF